MNDWLLFKLIIDFYLFENKHIIWSFKLYDALVVDKWRGVRKLVSNHSFKITNVAVLIDKISIWKARISLNFRNYWDIQAFHSEQILTIKCIMLFIFAIFKILLMFLESIKRKYQILDANLSLWCTFFEHNEFILWIDAYCLCKIKTTFGFMSFSSFSTCISK